MRKRRNRMTHAVGALLILLASSVRAQDIPTRDEGFAAAVRAAYAALEARLAEAGGGTVSVSDLRTTGLRSLAERPWTDLVTVGQKYRLQLDRTERIDGQLGWQTVQYKPHWEVVPALSAIERQFATAGALRVIDEASKAHPSLLDIQWLTTFRVTITTSDRSAEYRAAFGWVPTTIRGAFDAHVLDAVVPGLSQLVAETVPVGGTAWREDEELDGLASPLAAAVAAPQTCIAENSTQNFDRNPPAGTNQHISGGHKARFTFQTRCSCTTSCVSTCDVGVSVEQCFDTGVTSQASHVTGASVSTSVKSVPNATNVGAACAAGYNCNVKACLFGSCGLAINVVVNGVTVTFTNDPNPVWVQNLSGAFQCPKCRIQPPPPTEPPLGTPDPTADGPGGWGEWTYVPENQDPFPSPSGGGGWLPSAPTGCTWQCRPIVGVYGFSQFCQLRCPY